MQQGKFVWALHRRALAFVDLLARRRRAAVVMTSALALAMGAVIVTGQGASDPLIHSCVSKGLLGLAKGSIRIVQDPTQCKPSEDRLSWHHTGPAGPPGPPGPTGPPADGSMLWASVSDGGHIDAGSPAVTAERLSEGRYAVTFDRDVTTCAAFASVGTGGGVAPGVFLKAATPIIYLGISGIGLAPSQAGVAWHLEDGLVDTAFFITLMC